MKAMVTEPKRQKLSAVSQQRARMMSFRFIAKYDAIASDDQRF
jgi:hypothetical protein